MTEPSPYAAPTSTGSPQSRGAAGTSGPACVDVEIELAPEDLYAGAMAFLETDPGSRARQRWVAGWVEGWFAVSLVLACWVVPLPRGVSGLRLLLGLLPAAALAVYAAPWFLRTFYESRRIAARAHALVGLPVRFTFSPDGIVSRAATRGSGAQRWSAIERCLDRPGHLVLCRDDARFYTLPKGWLTSEELELVKGRVEAARLQPAGSSSSSQQPAQPAGSSSSSSQQPAHADLTDGFLTESSSSSASANDAVTLDFDLTMHDVVRALGEDAARAAPGRGRVTVFLLVTLLVMTAAAALGRALGEGHPSFLAVQLLVMAYIAFAAMCALGVSLALFLVPGWPAWYERQRLRRTLGPHRGIHGPRRVILDAYGVLERRRDGLDRDPWSAFVRCGWTAHALVLEADNGAATVIPRSALGDHAEDVRRPLVEHVRPSVAVPSAGPLSAVRSASDR